MGGRLGFFQVLPTNGPEEDDLSDTNPYHVKHVVPGPLVPVPSIEIPIEVETEPHQQLMELLESVEDTNAAAALFALLEVPGEPFTPARRRLLCELTAQDLGDDRRTWLTWWRDNRRHGRFEWLLEGLLDGDRTLHAQAAEQLRELTGETFDYDPLMSRRQREAVRGEYLEWWACKRWQADL